MVGQINELMRIVANNTNTYCYLNSYLLIIVKLMLKYTYKERVQD